ncbi:SDR family NAD(P)-dependent oxidoreductase [Kribbella sp. NBC_01505]|uniref:SDR family NAD(P)-dependent oxidoreductase n=1 Tax=Kribbella sp. NBC_01505 TaxID=2903580 RepID=UPI00386AC22F
MKTVVMTGATSGLGAVTARLIAADPEMRLLAGTRGKQVRGAETEQLDLARLASVREFAQKILERLGDTKIDVLLLNAGTNLRGDQRSTEDGYEVVFATNHLAHYLLLRLLAPQLSPTATIVITTSDTHDPKINRIAPPQHAYADLLASPPEDGGRRQGPVSFRAYASSKLCNLLTARAFARLNEGGQVQVVAYNPGFTPDTQLNRGTSRAIRIAMRVLVPLARRFAHINTAEEAGRTLADLALGSARPPEGRLYASLVRGKLTWPDPSRLAQSDDAMTSLWRESALLVGLKSVAEGTVE